MIKISASIITFCLFTKFVINAQSTPQIIPPQGHGIFPHDFDIHSNSKTIATCGLDRKIVLWDIRTGIPYLSVIGHRAEIRSIRYSWNSEHIITSSPDSTVNIWDSETLKLVKSIHTKTQNLYAEFNRTTTQIVEAKDSVNNLQNIQICLNGVPLYGKEGKRISGKNYTKNIKIDLVTGTNNIKIAATNSKGMESLKSTMHINYENEKKPNLYITCIGVSDYKDDRFDLKYAAKDAADFMATMEKSGSFGTINKKLITDAAVINENIATLKSFFEKAERDDVVILFVAGHGVLDKNFDYYYATNDIDFDNPSARGLTYSELEKVLDQIKAIKKLLLMDTCHSGELDKEDVQEDLAVNEEKDPNVTFRTTGVKISSSSSAVKTSILVKELFADILQNSGTTVISSSSGLEFSMESEQWKNGLFTYCLINGLQSKSADLDRDRFISVYELQQ